jgi:hypothetical protein
MGTEACGGGCRAHTLACSGGRSSMSTSLRSKFLLMSTSGTESAGMCSTTSGTGAPSGRFAVARPAADGGGGGPDILYENTLQRV